MTTFKGYLGYRLKRSMLQTVIFSFIAVLVAITSASDGASAAEWGGTPRTGIEALATMMGIIASVIPMIETACFKNRRNLDTLYFLPISRRDMALVHYLSGLIQVWAVYTVAFLTHFIVLWKFADLFRLGYMPLYYVLLLLLGVVVYSVFIFLFGEANSSADAGYCIVLWIFALYIVALAINYPIRVFAAEYVYGTTESARYWAFARGLERFAAWLIPYAPINNLTVVFQNLMEGTVEYVEDASKVSEELIKVHSWPTLGTIIDEKYPEWYMVFPWLVAGTASVWGYFRTFVRKGAEKAGDISNSRFCYKTLIPLYGFSVMVLLGTSGIGGVFVLASMYIGYAIYRRSFKIKPCDLIAMGVSSAAGLALAVAMSAISG